MLQFYHWWLFRENPVDRGCLSEKSKSNLFGTLSLSKVQDRNKQTLRLDPRYRPLHLNRGLDRTDLNEEGNADTKATISLVDNNTVSRHPKRGNYLLRPEVQTASHHNSSQYLLQGCLWCNHSNTHNLQKKERSISPFSKHKYHRFRSVEVKVSYHRCHPWIPVRRIQIYQLCIRLSRFRSSKYFQGKCLLT